MGYNEIYYEHDDKFRNLNQIKFKKFLELFREETGVDARNLYANEGIPMNDYISQFYYLKYIIFNYQPHLIKVFFYLLDISGYDLYSEVIDAMKLIGRESSVILDDSLKDYIMLSPYINGITNNKGQFTIHSDEFGDYSFASTKKYFENNLPALTLMRKYITANCCHQMSWAMMKHLDDAAIVTSLLPSYFIGTYYHTVIRNEDGMIVDIANDMVYDDDTRDYLFKGKIICETHKDNLEKSLEEAILAEDEEAKKIDYPEAMLLTLYQQSKRA